MTDTIPMMYRAQITGRSQLQRIKQNVSKQDSQKWTEEWVNGTDSRPPEFGKDVQTKTYTINWRFVTNGGQDDGIVRPVIGARGYPYYPGSSMKGIFRRACTREQAKRYCGGDSGDGHFNPGILRFHGGYPTNTDWRNNLVDLIHPQERWQVKENRNQGAFAQISLYQPELKFGISSTIPLEESEWDTIWGIFEKALSEGIGCRVSAGYGQLQTKKATLPYQPQLKGQGIASKLVNNEPEFRPNMFKATLRGHALRLFGGLTSPENAEKLVQQLFGGINREATVGLLNVSFQFNPDDLEIESFGQGGESAYNVKGKLCFSLTQSLDENQKKALIKVVKGLTRFAMVFGGFGKSWRRAYHRLFYPDYYKQRQPKPLIGCHWQWSGEKTLLNNTRYGVRNLDQVSPFIEKVRNDLQAWMRLQNIEPTPNNEIASDWRETWHPQKVQVWGRIADDADDSCAIEWLHRPYRPGDLQAQIREGTIKGSHITGQIGQIGRIWHRMYPLVKVLQSRNNQKEIKTKQTPQYLELFTFFPSDKPDQREDDFLQFLEEEEQMFQLLWGKQGEKEKPKIPQG